jgi:hypothetical protein
MELLVRLVPLVCKVLLASLARLVQWVPLVLTEPQAQQAFKVLLV